MARIRSIHPGFFTDERMVTVSPLARILYLGILCESDDQGSFDWKPVTLKMRLLPMDAVDMVACLSELVAVDAIKRVEIDGRELGLVRNFRRYQRPKKPNSRFVMPQEFRTYVGLTDDGSEPEPPSTDAGSEPSGDKPASVPQNGVEAPHRSRRREEGVGGRAETTTSNHNNLSPPRGKSRGRDIAYAFASGAIRLSASDLEKWKKAYPNLSLEAELMGLSEWAGQQPNWYPAVSGALAKKQREAVLALERVRIEAATKVQGPSKDPNDLWPHGL